MNRWPTKPLGDVLSQRLEEHQIIDASKEMFVTVRLYGKGAVPRKIGDGKTPVMRTGYRLKSGDLVYSRIDARNGAFALVGDELDGAVVSKDFPSFAIRCELVHPIFLCRFLGTEQFFAQLQASSFGTTNRQRIPEHRFLSYKIPVPPLAEQERIVKILDEADKLRKLRARADRRTAELIPAVFHEMFGDPVINSKEWPVNSLPDVCRGREGIKAGPFGSSLRKVCYTTAGPRVYGQEQVIADDFAVGDYHISEAKFDEMSAYSVAPGDLLISLVGTIGKATVVPDGIQPGIINPRLLRIRPRREIIDPCYLVNVLSSASVAHLFADMAGGSTMGVLNAGLLRRLSIPVPPLSLQNEFAKRVLEIHNLEADQAASRLRLEALFQSLLNHAFNGDL